MGEGELSPEASFNGVNAASGDYLLPPLSVDVVSRIATGEQLDLTEVQELRARFAALSRAYLGVIEGIDPNNLAEAGWGIVFAPGIDPAVRDALKPVVEHRREEASAAKDRRGREVVDADVSRRADAGGD